MSDKELTDDESTAMMLMHHRIYEAYQTSYHDWEIKHRASMDNVLYPEMSLVEYIDLLRGITTLDKKFLDTCQGLEEKQKIRVLAVTDKDVVVRVLGYSYL